MTVIHPPYMDFYSQLKLGLSTYVISLWFSFVSLHFQLILFSRYLEQCCKQQTSCNLSNCWQMLPQ